MIIGIAGKIGSGKDLAGLYLQHIIGNCNEYSLEQWENEYEVYREEQSNWEIKKFGGPLKDVVCVLLGCTREDLEDRDFKNKTLGKEWWYYTNLYDNKLSLSDRKELNDRGEYIISERLYTPTVRDLLQRLGTEAGREQIHPDIWVNALMKDYKQAELGYDIEDGHRYMVKGEYPNWIITDVRFPNEVRAIKDKGGIVIRLNRDVESGTHASETQLDGYEFDFVIENNGTKKELYDSLKKYLENKEISSILD